MRIALSLVASLALLACAPPSGSEDFGGAGPHDARATAAEKTDTTASAEVTPLPVAKPGSGSKRMVGYFPAWSVYDRNFHIADVPAEKLTHLNYGFMNLSAEGECVLGDPYADTQKPYPGDSTDATALKGSFHQLELLKAKTPGLKTLLSIGGWTWSEHFSAAAETDASRKKLVSSCVAIMKQYNFDGLDIDWEYPVSGGLVAGRAIDKANFTLLLQEFRSELGHSLLTIAGPAAPKVAANLELEKVASIVDWVNLMAYDFHGPFDKVTGHNAPLYGAPGDDLNVDTAVKTYLAARVPADKIVLGVAAYGRGFASVATTTNHGLGQAFSGTPKGTWEPGVFDFQDLEATYVSRLTRTWDPVAMVPTLFDPATNTLISYEDTQSAALKGQYIYDHGLGGGMIWELSADDADASILNTVRTKL